MITAMIRGVIIGALIGLTLAADAVASDRGQPPGLPRPNQLRIEGFVGEPPATASEATWTLKCLGHVYRFTVTKLRVLVGDVSYMDVIEEARPYRVAFTLHGDQRSLRRFSDADPGKKIAIIAYQRTGWRYLLVANITPVDAATPTP